MEIYSQTFVGAKPEEVLKKVFGYDKFRPLQKEIITEVLKGKDTLAIMPTGGGKSICYQIPALIMEGITVVVSPLISLMQDQVSSLEATGIHSVFLNSTLDWDEYKSAVNEIREGNVKIVYISPEGLSTGRIRDLLSEPDVKVSCITIDEAHCVSQWGHDFRPDYLDICAIRTYIPDAVMLALTATATQQVRTDIALNLRLKKPSVFVSSFDRSNIYLEVMPKRSAAEQVVNYLNKHKGESGIIYCFSRKQVDELTQTLDKLGFSVLNYHAGLSDEIRGKNQELFIKDEVQIMVATIAFGMGIDKPNVRFVINYDLPKSVEEYYQEIGRAGRDGLPSSALLLYSPGDIHKIRYFFTEAADPEKSELLLQGMINYATSRTCRRKALLSYFGESYAPSESNNCCCDICTNGEIANVDVTLPFQKLLSCILRTNERFGASYVIDVLEGSRNKRIVDNGHNMISTWGIGKEYPKEDWYELIDLLISENYLVKDPEYSVLKVTYMGRSALNNRDTVILPFLPSGKTGAAFNPDSSESKKPSYILHKKTERIIAETPDAGDEISNELIENLKAWRKRKADDMNVPPYVIFNDKTLLDIVAKRPKSKAELFNIYGLGNIKIENFGKSILNLLEDY